jgi:large subunit ribosomal protein L21
MTYAIIELGGKQYRVEEGDSVLVDRLDSDEGAKVSPRAVLFRSDSTALLEGPDLEKVKIEAVVTEHLKGEKVRVFKYRPKKRYRVRAGHRQLMTRLEIRRISGPGRAAKKKEAGGDEEKRPSGRSSAARSTQESKEGGS